MIGPETAGWGRDLPASVVFSAFPPSLSQAQSMPLCTQGPLPSGHGLNRQGGKGQRSSSALSPVLQQPQRGEPRSQPGSHAQGWRALKKCLLFSLRVWLVLRWLSLPVCGWCLGGGGCERSGGCTGLRAGCPIPSASPILSPNLHRKPLASPLASLLFPGSLGG